MASSGDARAGGAFVELYAKDTTTKVLNAIESRIKSMAVNVALIGATMAAGGAAVTAPMLYGLSVASEWTSELTSANRRTGIGFEDLQSLSYAFRVDMDGLAAATRTMSGQLEQAINEPAGEAARRIEALGLSVQDLQRATQADRLRAFGAALGNIGDEGQRIANARHIFGRQGAAMDVSGATGPPIVAQPDARVPPVIPRDARPPAVPPVVPQPGARPPAVPAAGASGIAQREERGRAVGAVMSAADVATIQEYNAATRELGIVTKAAWASIGVAIAPIMTDFVRIVTTIVSYAKHWIDNNRELIATVFHVADAAVFVGTAIGVLATVIYGTSYAFAFLSGAVGIVSGALSTLWTLSGIGIAITYGLMAAQYALSVAQAVWTGTLAAGIAAAFVFSGIVYAMTGSMFAYDVACLVATSSSVAFFAGMWLGSIAVAAFNGLLGLSSVIAIVWGASVVAAGLLVSGAMWAIGAAVATVSFLYGLLTGSAAAWSAVSSAGAMLLFGLFSAYAGIMAVVNFATWAYNAALAALAGGFGIAKIAAWLFAAATVPVTIGTTLATGGINLLAAAIAILALVAIPVLVVALASIFALPLLAIGHMIAEVLRLLRVFDTIGTMVSGTAASVTGSANRIADAFSSAWATTASGFTRMTSGLISDATGAWGGIKDAFAAGDMEMVWDIVKTAGLLAWAQISEFLFRTWAGWKYALFTLWDSVSDSLRDAFSTSLTAVRLLWADVMDWVGQSWGEVFGDIWRLMITGFSRAISNIEGLWTTSLNWLSSALSSLWETEAVQIAAAPTQAAAAAPASTLTRRQQIEQQAATDRTTEEARRLERDAARIRLRDAEMQGAGNQSEIDRLRGELGRLNEAAMGAAEWARFSREQDVAHGAGAFDATAGRSANLGTFSASAASGYAGGAPMDRLQRTSEEQLAVARQIRDLIQNGGGAIG